MSTNKVKRAFAESFARILLPWGYLLDGIKKGGIRDIKKRIIALKNARLAYKIAKRYGISFGGALITYYEYTLALAKYSADGNLLGYDFNTHNSWRDVMLHAYPFEDFVKENLKEIKEILKEIEA